LKKLKKGRKKKKNGKGTQIMSKKAYVVGPSLGTTTLDCGRNESRSRLCRTTKGRKKVEIKGGGDKRGRESYNPQGRKGRNKKLQGKLKTHIALDRKKAAKRSEGRGGKAVVGGKRKWGNFITSGDEKLVVPVLSGSERKSRKNGGVTLRKKGRKKGKKNRNRDALREKTTKGLCPATGVEATQLRIDPFQN